MKTLILILLTSVCAFGQINVTNNPYDPVEAGETLTTSITEYRITAYADNITYAKITFPSGNASTAKVSTQSATAITASPDFAAGTTVNVRIRGGRFWIKLEDAGDTFTIEWL